MDEETMLKQQTSRESEFIDYSVLVTSLSLSLIYYMVVVGLQIRGTADLFLNPSQSNCALFPRNVQFQRPRGIFSLVQIRYLQS